MELEEIIAALVGAISGGLVTFLVTYFTLRFNYRQLFAETISSSRERWLRIFRENLSKFIACAELLNKNITSSKHIDDVQIKKELLEAKAMMTSRLNFNEELHCTFFERLESLNINNNPDFYYHKEDLMNVARDLMKEEWEKVKDEARGKRK